VSQASHFSAVEVMAAWQRGRPAFKIVSPSVYVIALPPRQGWSCVDSAVGSFLKSMRNEVATNPGGRFESVCSAASPPGSLLALCFKELQSSSARMADYAENTEIFSGLTLPLNLRGHVLLSQRGSDVMDPKGVQVSEFAWQA